MKDAAFFFYSLVSMKHVIRITGFDEVAKRVSHRKVVVFSRGLRKCSRRFSCAVKITL